MVHEPDVVRHGRALQREVPVKEAEVPVLEGVLGEGEVPDGPVAHEHVAAAVQAVPDQRHAVHVERGGAPERQRILPPPDEALHAQITRGHDAGVEGNGGGDEREPLHRDRVRGLPEAQPEVLARRVAPRPLVPDEPRPVAARPHDHERPEVVRRVGVPALEAVREVVFAGPDADGVVVGDRGDRVGERGVACPGGAHADLAVPASKVAGDDGRGGATAREEEDEGDDAHAGSGSSAIRGCPLPCSGESEHDGGPTRTVILASAVRASARHPGRAPPPSRRPRRPCTAPPRDRG